VFDDTYNIIDIKNNKVQVDIKMVGGKKVPLLDIVKRFKQKVRTEALPA
jgi:Icc protein